MYDVVGGGFARYSTDDFWRLPHFEKMLYDNAQLALAYLHGWLLTREAQFRRVCEATLDFILREMAHPQGGFYASLDADSEGEEGKFYAWTLQEIRQALDDPQDAALFIAAYAITETGNFEGKTVLQRALEDAPLAEMFDLPVEAIPTDLERLHQRLLAARGGVCARLPTIKSSAPGMPWRWSPSLKPPVTWRVTITWQPLNAMPASSLIACT